MSTSVLRLCFFILTAWFATAPGVHAAVHTWKGGGGDNYWSNEDNWIGGAPDDDDGTVDLVFPATAQSYHTVCDLSYFYVRKMIFRGNYTVSQMETVEEYTIRLIGSGGGIVMDSATPRTVIFDASTSLVATGGGLSVSMTSGTLRFQGFLSFEGTMTGAGDVYFEGIDAMYGSYHLDGLTLHLKGNTPDMKAKEFTVGAGATLSVEKNWQINGAKVHVAGGLLTVGAGMLDATGPLELSGNGAVNALSAGAALQFNDTVTCSGGSSYLLGHFLLGGKTREFAVPDSAAALTISGVLEDGAGLEGLVVVTTGGIRKTGAGLLRLGSSGTFHGPVVVAAGELQASTDSAFGAAGAGVTVSSGAQLSLKGISVSGEALTLGGKLMVLTGTNSWTGNITLNSSADHIAMLPAPETCVLKHTGVISGPGTLGLEGGGTLELAGAGSNSYTGETVVLNGVVHLNKSSGNAIPGPLTIDPYLGGIDTGVILDADNQIADDAMILLVGLTAVLDLNSQNETVGGLVSFSLGAGQVRLGNSRTGTATFVTGMNNLSTSYTGTITGAPGMTLVKSGTGQFKTTTHAPSLANSFTGQTRITGGALEVDFNQKLSQVVVKPGGMLSGSGTTGAVILDGGNLALSHLRTGSVSANPSGGKFLADLLGPAPAPGGFDQLTVTGQVNLTGTTFLGGLGFAPASGAKFVIIQNDGTDAVTGQFTGLPEGANLNIGGKPFSISYHGGDGNDVELRFVGSGGPPRILSFSYDRGGDKVHIEALGPPGIACQWQFSTGLKSWATFATGVPDSAGLLKLDQSLGLNAGRMFFRLVQP